MGKDLNLQVLEQAVAALEAENKKLRDELSQQNKSVRNHLSMVNHTLEVNQKLREELSTIKRDMATEAWKEIVATDHMQLVASLREACAALESMDQHLCEGIIDDCGFNPEHETHKSLTDLVRALSEDNEIELGKLRTTLATLKARHPNLGETKE